MAGRYGFGGGLCLFYFIAALLRSRRPKRHALLFFYGLPIVALAYLAGLMICWYIFLMYIACFFIAVDVDNLRAGANAEPEKSLWKMFIEYTLGGGF